MVGKEAARVGGFAQDLYEISRQAVHAVLKAYSCGPCAHVRRKAVWKPCRRGAAPAKAWHYVREAVVVSYVDSPDPALSRTQATATLPCAARHAPVPQLPAASSLATTWPPPGACLLSVPVPAGASFLSPRLLIRHPGYHLTPVSTPCLMLPHACPPTCCHLAPAVTSSLPQCLLPPHPCLAPAATSFLPPTCCHVLSATFLSPGLLDYCSCCCVISACTPSTCRRSRAPATAPPSASRTPSPPTTTSMATSSTSTSSG